MPSYEVEVTIVQLITVTVNDVDSIEEAEAYAERHYDEGSYISEEITDITAYEIKE